MANDIIDHVVEAVGKYRGREYRVIFRRCSQARCGYVEVSYDELENNTWDDFDVHGGITYTDTCSTEQCLTGLYPGHWIGFDCIHAYDAADLETSRKYFLIPETEEDVERFGEVRSTDYCINECKKLIDQLA